MVSGSVCTKFQVSAVFFILSGVRPELVHSTQQFLEKPFRLRHVDLKTTINKITLALSIFKSRRID